MRALVTLFIVTLAASGTAIARSPCPADIQPGMSYHLARAKLIESGFLPVQAASGNKDAVNARFSHLGYIEHFDTAMTMPETSPLFLWNSNKGKFIVETRGDATPKVVACDPY